MNADRLLALYGDVSEAPGAIVRLRSLVLDLAIRGKLVEQDPTDEPASELLKRIAIEKVRLVKAKEIKNSKVPSLDPDAYPYPIPANWCWTELGTVGDWGAGSTPSRSNPDLYGGGVTWLKSGELGDRLDLKGSHETVTETAVQSGSFRRNQPGDVLIAMYGATIGKLAILSEEAVTNQAVCGCSPFTGVSNRFLFLFLLARRSAFQASSEGGAQPNISKVKIIGTPFSLPPIAEQRRIVEKVDELMALLDRLEAAREQRETTRDRLTAASLVRLTSPDTTLEEFPSHARFALDALPALTTRPDQIKSLRQSVLNLAVRGKLVEQDPTDEPASELLKRVVTEKARLGLVKSENARIPISNDAVSTPFYSSILPKSWLLVSVIDVAVLRSGVALRHGEAQPTGEVPYLKVADLALPDNEFGLTTSSRFVTSERLGDSIAAGSIVFPKRGGAIATNRKRVAKVDIVGDSNLMALKPCLDETLPFIEMWFRSFDLWSLNSGTSVPQINNKDIYPLPLPLPPITEQHRIVTKVDALMTLCDRLETVLTTADTTRARLLESLLHEALASPDSATHMEAAE